MGAPETIQNTIKITPAHAPNKYKYSAGKADDTPNRLKIESSGALKSIMLTTAKVANINALFLDTLQKYFLLKKRLAKL